ncbi:MAG: hypothetical protein M3R17_06570, partial [Bacteroidota bacterium]|nr:hypothetical protein [Bacteroidota bacterium]
METLNFGYDFLIFIVVVMFALLVAAISIIAAVVFTIKALEKHLPLRMLIIFWLLFIPSVVIGLCYS